MYLRDFEKMVFERLKSDPELDDCIVIEAYPYVKKPSRLKKTIITVSSGGVEAESAELGGSAQLVQFSVKVDIFIPIENGPPAKSKVFDKMIDSLGTLMPSKIKITEFKPENELGAQHAGCTVSFYGRYTEN